MKYHTNHSWCSNSCWDNKFFDAEVIVSITNFIDTYRISSFDNKIVNPDWNNLIEVRKDYFDEENYKNSLDFKRKLAKEFNKDFDESTFPKELFIKENKYLKQEVIDWLNENIKDKIGTDQDTPIEDRKGWAIGNDEYRSKDNKELMIFFDKQVDALKFIRKFSIFKEPTFYFDYFETKNADMDPEKILSIINKETNQNLSLDDIVVKERTFSNIIEIDYNNFDLKIWNEDGECEDLTGEKLKLAIQEILSVDNEDNIDNDLSM